jgi:dinuclear metal center YbgI/SA1388 family protein
MKVAEIYKYLNEISPFEFQESWDNSGLMVGDMDAEVQQVALSIDVDEKLIDSLEENTLLITHHPLIFRGLKQLEYGTYPSNLLVKMITKNISNIAMHTNFDKTHLNLYVAQEVLGYEIVEEKDFLITMRVEEDFTTVLKRVKEVFALETTRVVACHDKLSTIALTTGSGCSLLGEVDADCFLTGDIKYHDAMEAKARGLSLIEIGHYESEHFFAQILQKHLKNLGLKVIIAQSENPFSIM